MAPTVVAGSANVFNTTALNSATFALPNVAGQDGDWWYAMVATRQPNLTTGYAISGAWTATSPYSEGSTSASAVYRKPWAPGDGGSSVTHDLVPSTEALSRHVGLVLIRGADATEPESAKAGALDTPDNNTGQLPGLTPLHADCLLLAFAYLSQDVLATTFGTVSGMTLLDSEVTGTADGSHRLTGMWAQGLVGGSGVAVAQKAVPTDSAKATPTLDTRGYMFALKPAVADTTPPPAPTGLSAAPITA